MQGNATDFPRPYGVQAAEAAREATMVVELPDPTYREALGMEWGGVVLGAMSVAELVRAGAEAQRLMAAGRDRREATLYALGWRTHRAALLVLFRSRQSIGWTYKARTAEDWRAVGDDYLRPYGGHSVSWDGLCYVVGFDNPASARALDAFKPSSYENGYWWGDPANGSLRSRAVREQRAWACYFIAAMLDEEAER